MIFSMDSNCLVALLHSGHPLNAQTSDAYLKIRGVAEGLVLSSHSRLETLSVLTRMPPPARVSLEHALESLDRSFGFARLEQPLEEDYAHAIEACFRVNLAGGVLYDALIAHSVHRHGATKLLTWNTKHMKLVAPSGLEVLRPDMVAL
jgi:predicted nucleic acid-binding protein